VPLLKNWFRFFVRQASLVVREAKADLTEGIVNWLRLKEWPPRLNRGFQLRGISIYEETGETISHRSPHTCKPA
jgi:hypothetical protein